MKNIIFPHDNCIRHMYSTLRERLEGSKLTPNACKRSYLTIDSDKVIMDLNPIKLTVPPWNQKTNQ